MMNKVVDNYVLLDKLGAGQFAEVFSGKDRVNEIQVAVKVYSLAKFMNNPKLKEMILNEIRALQDLNSPNIIHFYKMLKTTNNIYLVYEFCDNKTLEDYIISKKFLGEKEALGFMRQLANAFKEMQAKNIIHRDVKPSNIMLTSSGILKLADFGLCKYFDPIQEQREKLENIINQAFEKTILVGSPIYMAPELLRRQPLNRKVDLYSLGIVLYEMLFGVCPFEESNVENLLLRIEKTNLNFPLERNPISPRTQALIRDLIRPDSIKRIEWDRFFAFFEEDMLEIKDKAYGEKTEGKFKQETLIKPDGLIQIEGVVKPNEVLFKPEPVLKPDLAIKTELIKQEINFKTEGFTIKPETIVPKTESLSSLSVIDKRILKEKNKIIYLSNVINAALDLNLNNLTIPAIISFLRFQVLIYDNLLDLLRQDIPNEAHISTVKVSADEWLRYKTTEKHRVFTKMCHDELLKVKENLQNFFKNSQNELKSFAFSSFELKREEITEILYYYCKTVQAHAVYLLSENEKDLGKKILIHANNTLDAMRLEEFFEKLINEDIVKIDEQSYFSKILGFSIAKYLRLIEDKLEFFKKIVQK